MSQRQRWEEKAFAIAESIASTTSQIDSLCRSRSARDMLIKTLDRGGIMQTKDEDSDPYVEKIKESISRMLAINSELESEFRTLVKVVSQKFGELSLYLDNASHRTSRAFHNAIVDYVARVDSEDAVAVQNEFNYQQDEFRKAMRGHFSIE
ncbi:hypothetical protein [Nocardiopsis alba]|uniref:hypothetical protein n=1 Tax=Nocardiopsis alba TaxID=53437 RepID=UPI00131A6D39|nr:hypothetical protein [Nocardiopsis alba]